MAISVNGPFHDAPAEWLGWMRRTLLLFHIAWIGSIVALPVGAIPHAHVFPVLVALLRTYCLWRATRAEGQPKDRRSAVLARLFGLVDAGLHVLVLVVWYPVVWFGWYLVLAVLTYFSLLLFHSCMMPYYWLTGDRGLVGAAIVTRRCGPIFVLLTSAMVYFDDHLPAGPIGGLLFLVVGILPLFALTWVARSSIEFDKHLRTAWQFTANTPWLDST